MRAPPPRRAHFAQRCALHQRRPEPRSLCAPPDTAHHTIPDSSLCYVSKHSVLYDKTENRNMWHNVLASSKPPENNKVRPSIISPYPGFTRVCNIWQSKNLLGFEFMGLPFSCTTAIPLSHCPRGEEYFLGSSGFCPATDVSLLGNM